MGNFSSKDGHGQPATGTHLDVFHTAPNSPVSEAPSLSQPASGIDFTAGSSPVPAGTKSHLAGPATPTAPTTTQPPPPTTPTPISPNSATICPPLITPPVQNKPGSVVVSPKRPPVVAVGRNGCPSGTSTPRTHLSQAKSVAASPTKRPSSPPSTASSPTASPSESSWKDGDSGLCPSPSPLQANGARGIQGEEMERMLEEYRTTLGSASSQSDALSATELLRGLLTEVTTLRSTIQAERGEWQQFQADLQVAVAVADRLRAEAEEELTALRAAHRDLERELATAQRRQREADGQLAALRDQLKESRQTTTGAALAPQAPQQGKVQALQQQAPNRASSRSGGGDNNRPAIEISNCDDEREEGAAQQRQQQRGRERGTSSYRAGREGTATRGSQSEAAKKNPATEEDGKMDSTKGVANRYLRTLTNEERRGEEGQANETRRAVATERSRSLSRLPVSSDTSPAVQNGISQSNTSIPAGSTNKNAGQPKSRRSLDPQDSWSSTHIGKREELLNKYNSALTEVPPAKSQDGFNLLLRRHGGSKRNSLLRWCQNRTQGYKNIDITNFSSSWADGLAFCAVYHTYLPSHIPYCTLSPESKQENLSLAFKTGENVGIAQSLTMEEMLRAGGPDWQRVLSYVESMYRHFEM